MSLLEAGLTLVGYLFALGAIIGILSFIIVKAMPDVEDPYDATHDE